MLGGCSVPRLFLDFFPLLIAVSITDRRAFAHFLQLLGLSPDGIKFFCSKRRSFLRMMAEVVLIEDIEASATRLGIDLSSVDLDSIQLPRGEDFGIKRLCNLP